jgi:hypothetical protein
MLSAARPYGRSRGLRPLRLLLLPTDRFDSACQINDFLSTVIDLVVKNEIFARRAAVLAYITNQLLRTLPIIQQENPPQFIFDLPRPKPQPEPQSYDYPYARSADPPNTGDDAIDGTPACTRS